MPPSGFSKKAIDGLLLFVQANYQNAFNEYQQSQLPEDQALRESSTALERTVQESVKYFPGISEEGVQGLSTFMTECYGDLIDEIHAGQDKYNRPVVNGEAIQKELDQIESYLTEFTI